MRILISHLLRLLLCYSTKAMPVTKRHLGEKSTEHLLSIIVLGTGMDQIQSLVHYHIEILSFIRITARIYNISIESRKILIDSISPRGHFNTPRGAKKLFIRVPSKRSRGIYFHFVVGLHRPLCLDFFFSLQERFKYNRLHCNCIFSFCSTLSLYL